MNAPKFLSIFQRIFLCKKISADFNLSAFSATCISNHNSPEMKRKIILVTARSYTMPSGVPGAGAGRGGGSGGSVRESGGGLGRYGAAQETGYFLKKNREQLARIKKKMKQDSHHADPTKKQT